jgi:hypothetical protein
MSQNKTRDTHAAAILGPELHARLPDTRVLLVGAGGIGCELCTSGSLPSITVEIMTGRAAVRSIRILIISAVYISKKYCNDRLRGHYAVGSGYY